MLSPEFFRWLVNKHLERRFYEVFGHDKTPEQLAASAFRGTWIKGDTDERKLILQTTSPAACLSIARSEFEREKNNKEA